VGFDPYRGFYHQPRYGRPALALDMMEPFRPLIADSSVIQVINNGEVRPSDFISAAGSVALDPDGRKRFISAFERRLSHEVTHPVFGYRVSYRRLLEVQARLLGRHLLGEIDDYPNFVTRWATTNACTWWPTTSASPSAGAGSSSWCTVTASGCSSRCSSADCRGGGTPNWLPCSTRWFTMRMTMWSCSTWG